MSVHEYRNLLAERGTLQQILADIPDEDVLDRGSFQARLEDVESRIAAVAPGTRHLAQARLTFRGRPVVGSHGVFAKFGTKATNDFVDAVSAMAAALTAPLGSAGPIPNQDQNQLLITGTVVGSFGFELEEYHEPQGNQLPLGLEIETDVARALAQARDLLESTLGSDDELADAVTSIDPRARSEVRKFLETVAMNEASFALDIGQKAVNFRNVDEVRRGLHRLGQDSLHESQEFIEGKLQGVLPKGRTFEFKPMGDEPVMTGRLGPGIVDPDVLNQHLNELARIKVTAVRVGTGRPRYVLNELPTWLDQTTQRGPEPN